jgi:hypothetical protein
MKTMDVVVDAGFLLIIPLLLLSFTRDPARKSWVPKRRFFLMAWNGMACIV